MLRVWGRPSSINVRKVVLCAQVLSLPQPRLAWPHLERWYAQWLAMPASRGVLKQPLS